MISLPHGLGRLHAAGVRTCLAAILLLVLKSADPAHAAAVAGAIPPSLRVVAGSIEGAQFTMAIPDPWNRNVLILAHGYRPETAPLRAEVSLDDPAHAKLLSEGWMIAATSYRRNGLIVRDAVDDVLALRQHIEATEGRPSVVILMGDSMGGAVATHIAEQPPGGVHGAVAVGAALHLREDDAPLPFTHAPRIPLLFLSNRSEADAPRAYAEQAAEAPVAPALWTVARDGHVNVNHAERTKALEGLITWITTGQIESPFDATVALETHTSDVTFSEGAAHGSVRAVTDDFGNIFTSFRPDDLAALGIHKGTGFVLEAGGRMFHVHYGSDYGDVPRGEWIAFDRAEGTVLIARHYENAAETAGVSEGDELVIRAGR